MGRSPAEMPYSRPNLGRLRKLRELLQVLLSEITDFAERKAKPRTDKHWKKQYREPLEAGTCMCRESHPTKFPENHVSFTSKDQNKRGGSTTCGHYDREPANQTNRSRNVYY